MASSSERRSLLVVTTCFAPENAVGSVRLVKLVKYLVRLGYEISVISPELDADIQRDEALECEELDQVARFKIGQSRIFRRLFSRKRKSVLSSRSAIELISSSSDRSVKSRVRATLFQYVHFLYTMIRNWDWSRQVQKFIRKEMVKQRFHTVISSYPSIGAMWAASWLKRTGRAEYWIGDFRDPIAYEKNSTAATRRIYSILQQRIVNTCDVVIAVSGGVADKLTGRESAEKIHVLPNGFDPDDCESLAPLENSEADHRRFRLAYVGSLYGGGRDITVVFEAIKKVLDKDPIDGSAFEFVYAGKDYLTLARQAESAGLQSILVNKGRVTRQQALGIQNSADIVVVATWNSEEDQGIMTGKLFECFLLRKPIIGVVGGTKPNSEFKAVVERVGAGFVYEAADSNLDQFSDLTTYLGTKVYHWSRGETVESEYNERTLEYAYPNLVRGLIDLIEAAER